MIAKMSYLEIVGGIGIMFIGYFIGRIIEAMLIGSWNYPKNLKAKYLEGINDK